MSTVSRPPETEPGRRRPGQRTAGAEAFVISPFARLARAHACSTGGDALFAIALADSLFFSIDPNDARWRVSLYLLLTAAPFAVVAPWLGPAMDRFRGGHRYMMIASAATRSLIALAVATSLDSLWLFPLAFSMLVMGKTHHIAKSAMVPGIVRNHDGLVAANSRLSIISAVSAAVFGIPGVIFLKTGGAPWVLVFGSAVFATGAMLGFRIPAQRVAAAPAGPEEKAEMRGAGIVLAASSMGYVRGVVGFLTMLLAFELRGGIDPGPIGTGVEVGHRIREALGAPRLELASGGAPTWHFGMVLVATGLGGLAGAFLSPRLRTMVREERILAGALGAVGVMGLLAALAGGLIGAMIAAFVVAIAAQAGKQAFDAIVQRDARASNLGRSFAKFETRFQLVWVLGALIPVVIPIPARLGFLLVAAASTFAAVSYWLGRDPSPSTAKPRAAAKRAAERVASRRDSGQSAATGEPEVRDEEPAEPGRRRRPSTTPASPVEGGPPIDSTTEYPLPIDTPTGPPSPPRPPERP